MVKRRPCVPDLIGVWECWFLRRVSKVSAEKPLEAKERTNNKLSPHMASTSGFQPTPQWWEATALTTAPPCPPCVVDRPYHFQQMIESIYRIYTGTLDLA